MSTTATQPRKRTRPATDPARDDPNSPWMRVGAVAVAVGMSIREVWRRASADKSFPKPRQLSTRITVWVRSEVQGWVKDRMR